MALAKGDVMLLSRDVYCGMLDMQGSLPVERTDTSERHWSTQTPSVQQGGMLGIHLLTEM